MNDEQWVDSPESLNWLAARLARERAAAYQIIAVRLRLNADIPGDVAEREARLLELWAKEAKCLAKEAESAGVVNSKGGTQ